MKIRPMKYSVCLILSVLTLWLVAGFGNVSGYAATKGIDSLNPNEYKEKEFKDNKEYIHNESLLESKKEIPNEQKQLDFIPEDYDPNEKLTHELFVKNFQERKTVAYESMKLGLFSKDLESKKVQAERTSLTSQDGNKSLHYIFLGLLLVCFIILLIWLVPKMVQGEKS